MRIEWWCVPPPPCATGRGLGQSGSSCGLGQREERRVRACGRRNLALLAAAAGPAGPAGFSPSGACQPHTVCGICSQRSQEPLLGLLHLSLAHTQKNTAVDRPENQRAWVCGREAPNEGHVTLFACNAPEALFVSFFLVRGETWAGIVERERERELPWRYAIHAAAAQGRNSKRERGGTRAFCPYKTLALAYWGGGGCSTCTSRAHIPLAAYSVAIALSSLSHAAMRVTEHSMG